MNQAPQILTINLGAVVANYRHLCHLAGGVRVGVSIKADAYGLGARRVGQALENAGCTAFFVAHAAEGVRLRQAVGGDIYVFGGPQTGDAATFRQHNLTPCLNSLADIENHAGGPCAIFFDTGLNRLGLSPAETEQLIDNKENYNHLDVRLCLSHFACSEDTAHPLNAAQCARIDTIRAKLAPHFPKALWSMCNTSGVFHYPQALYDMARCGYAVYGGNPTPALANPMRPVVALETRVLQVRAVRAGDTIGYSATHSFQTDTHVATLCLGYADGFTRAHQKGGAVLYWRGTPCPVIGRISMDLAAIDIGHIPEHERPKAGDMVEVLGPHQDIDQLAQSAATIGYEMLTSLGMRYQRRYIETP